MNPFDIAKNINKKEERLQDAKAEGYNAFMLNRIFSNTKDTALFANEMNMAWGLPAQLQYDFYYYGLTKKNRFGKWNKNTLEKEEAILLIKEYFNYSTLKAREVLPVLTSDDLAQIKSELKKGGLKNA